MFSAAARRENENGAPPPGVVRRELLLPTHFSRGRTPENGVSPRRVGLAVAYNATRSRCFGKSPVSIKPQA